MLHCSWTYMCPDAYMLREREREKERERERERGKERDGEWISSSPCAVKQWGCICFVSLLLQVLKTDASDKDQEDFLREAKHLK